MTGEVFERRLLRAGFDALRELGGEALAQVLVSQAGRPDLDAAEGPDRVPIEDYLAFRDAALELLEDGFCATAFEAGRILAGGLQREHEGRVGAFVGAIGPAGGLAVIGQAAVLGARGNPGEVRAEMQGDDELVVTIADCPECRGLQREVPFCFVNQGLMTRFATDALGLDVLTEETRCIAVGDSHCEIKVSVRR